MKISKYLIWISWIIVVLAVLATGVGLFWGGEGRPYPFTTLRGDTVEIYGRGLYRYDTSLIAVGYKVLDAVTLILGVPLLIISILRYQRGSLKGGLLLTGVLAYFLYYYGSMAFGAAYNDLFLAYVILRSLS